MKTERIVRYLTAAGAALLLSACASTSDVEMEKCFIVTPNADVTQMAQCDYSQAVNYNLKPGMIYICPKFAEAFELGKVESNVTEDGLVSARVYGKTKPYDLWTWLIKGEAPYKVAFRFIWFDKNGKILRLKNNTPLRIRETMPGQTVRFSDLAPAEDCKSFCFAVGILHDKEIVQVEEEQKQYGAELDRQAPPKIDPSKQVKVVK